MAETKTFKHPLGLTSAFEDNWITTGDTEQQAYEIYTQDSGYQTFKLDEWDIEVTFTRKEKPIKVGDTVHMLSDWHEEPYEVLAITAGYLWIQDIEGEDRPLSVVSSDVTPH